MKSKLIILGAPASGKSTIAQKLAAKYNLPHISPGKILRDEVARGTEIGKAVEELINKGELVPDKIVDFLLERRLSQKDCQNGFIIDGSPRTLNQVNLLDETLKKLNLSVDVVINLDLTDDEVVKRVSSRRVCSDSKCGATYNLLHNPPKHENTCDVCGAELTQRMDDKEEVVRKRLQIFHEITKPVLKVYENKGNLKTFDAATKDLFERIENYTTKTKDLGWVEKLKQKLEKRENSDSLTLPLIRI